MDWVDRPPVAPRAVHVINDDCEVVSQATGQPFTSKAAYRADLKARGWIEIGNDRIEPKPFKPTPVRETMERVAWEKGVI